MEREGSKGYRVGGSRWREVAGSVRTPCLWGFKEMWGRGAFSFALAKPCVGEFKQSI